MINQISDGLTLTFTATKAITAGELVHLGGGVCGIAVNDVLNGATGVVQLRGIYTVPKVGTTAITRGAVLKLGTATNTVAAASAGTTLGNYLLLRPIVASTTAMTTVQVILGY